jgi:hypothetical protein
VVCVVGEGSAQYAIQGLWTAAFGVTNARDEEYFLNKFDLTGFGQPTIESL